MVESAKSSKYRLKGLVVTARANPTATSIVIVHVVGEKSISIIKSSQK